jgi:hypothetical protein
VLGPPVVEVCHRGDAIAFEVKPAIRVRDLQDGLDAVPAIGVFLVGQVLVEDDRDPPCHAASSMPERCTG